MAMGARVLAGALSIAFALAAPGRAGAAGDLPGGSGGLPASSSEPASPRFAALSPLPAPEPHPEPFGWAAPSASASDRDAVRWRTIAETIAADRAVLAACRAVPGSCPPGAQQLLAIVEAARAKEGRARLGEVNRAINLAIAYASDLLRHGTPDLWSAPLATFASGRGDCEDYAIAKYLALVELGLAPRDLRLIVVETRLRRQHAVLGVRLDGRWLVLDNARFVMAEDRDLSAYRAIAVLGGEEDAAPAAVAPTIAAGSPPADAVPVGGPAIFHDREAGRRRSAEGGSASSPGASASRSRDEENRLTRPELAVRILARSRSRLRRRHPPAISGRPNMRTILILGAVLTVLSGPALAQYGGSGQSAGGPLGSYARKGGFYGGYAYGPYFGTYAAIAPVYFHAGPAFYGRPPGYYGYPVHYGYPASYGYYVYRRR